MRRRCEGLFLWPVVLLLAGCGYRTPWQEQRLYADSLKPAAVTPAAAAPAGPLRVFHVRAYADADYRTQTPRWNHHIEEQLHRASAVLEAQFGVRLELESARAWDRPGSSANLPGLIPQLAALDAGAGVDWVIGFVAAQDLFSAAQDNLGVAGLFSKYLVLRGMFSAAEMDAIDKSLNLLSRADREELSRERRLHKETAVLLHEWAHTLGAVHDRSPQSLMAPIYDKSQDAFSEFSARVIGVALDFRDAPQGRATWARKYREELTRPTASFYDVGERDRALAAADAFFATTPAISAAAALPAEDKQRLEEVTRLEKAGDAHRALSLLLPLIDRHPRSAMVQEMDCALLQETGASRRSMLTGCARAAALPEASAQVLLVTAQLQLGEGVPAAALPLLARAEKNLPATPALWLWLAQLQLAAGSVSAAERALTHAAGEKGTPGVAEACNHLRRFVGFPGEPLAPEREAAYLSAALAAHGQIDRQDLKGAHRAAALLARDFPGTPAAGVIECRIASRERNLAAIEKACASAADGAPGAFLPRYILGLVAGARAQWTEADAALRGALQLDGSTREVWASLAAVQRRLHATPALGELKSKYRERFGAALSPALFPPGWTAR